jgi:thiosulfate sulfurtransferase
MTVREISTEDALARLEAGDATFMDVRDPGSHRSSHIPGARPVGDHNISDFVASEDKSRTVIVYCYAGNSSKGGAAYLTENGFEDVYSMRGGFGAWGSGKPVEEAPPPPPREKRPPATAADYEMPEPRPETGRVRKRDRIKARLKKAVEDAAALFEFI